jgi:hypothetical protein
MTRRQREQAIMGRLCPKPGDNRKGRLASALRYFGYHSLYV